MSHPKETLYLLGASARKSLSQNFLTSPHWAERLTHVVTQAPEPDEYWEIGPGLGALTSKLVERTAKPVRAFEYDKKLAPHLKETLPAVDVIQGDFLDQDLATISPGKKISVLSNLPYHLSSPILFKLLEEKNRLVRLVLTFQKEFAERLIAQPSTSDYGALSVIAQLSFHIDPIGVLPPGAFYPVPSIASEALLLEPKQAVPHGVAHVSYIVKAAFRQRRKKLSSNLKKELPGVPVEAALERIGISLNARPEELSKDEYISLTGELKPGLCATVCEK